MLKSVTVTVATLVAGVSVLAAPAFAGGASDFAPGKNKDALISHYQSVEPTGSPTPTDDGLIKNLGGAISGGFYGNTSNSGSDIDAPASGHGVTPSISPGPKVTSSDGTVVDGLSVGEFIQLQRDLAQ
jgi:hypothetical protein